MFPLLQLPMIVQEQIRPIEHGGRSHGEQSSSCRDLQTVTGSWRSPGKTRLIASIVLGGLLGLTALAILMHRGAQEPVNGSKLTGSEVGVEPASNSHHHVIVTDRGDGTLHCAASTSPQADGETFVVYHRIEGGRVQTMTCDSIPNAGAGGTIGLSIGLG